MVVNRRDLLKFFGIGTAITPVINGAPVVEAAARLLAVPEVGPLALSGFPNGHAPANGRYGDRLKWNPYEAIWLYFWQIENNPPGYLNYGIGALEHLLGHYPTEEEKACAAGMMQWFGTNCGHCFIEETLKACGYRLNYDAPPGSSAKQINSLRHANVCGNQADPEEVRISYRGRTVTLRANEVGGVDGL